MTSPDLFRSKGRQRLSGAIFDTAAEPSNTKNTSPTGFIIESAPPGKDEVRLPSSDGPVSGAQGQRRGCASRSDRSIASRSGRISKIRAAGALELLRIIDSRSTRSNSAANRAGSNFLFRRSANRECLRDDLSQVPSPSPRQTSSRSSPFCSKPASFNAFFAAQRAKRVLRSPTDWASAGELVTNPAPVVSPKPARLPAPGIFRRSASLICSPPRRRTAPYASFPRLPAQGPWQVQGPLLPPFDCPCQPSSATPAIRRNSGTMLRNASWSAWPNGRR